MPRPKGTTKPDSKRGRMQIRCTEEERVAFEARAKAVGYSTPEWARTLLRRDAGMWTGQEEENMKIKTRDQIEAAIARRTAAEKAYKALVESIDYGMGSAIRGGPIDAIALDTPEAREYEAACRDLDALTK